MALPVFFCICTLRRYFGVDKFSVGGAETEYIVLEDLTEKCERPNVMDIKIGSRTYGPDALEKKRNHEVIGNIYEEHACKF